MMTSKKTMNLLEDDGDLLEDAIDVKFEALSVGDDVNDDDDVETSSSSLTQRIITRFQEYHHMIAHILTWKFVAFLCFSQFFGKGLLNRLVSAILLPIFKDLGTDAGTLQIYTAAVFLPWSMKPLMGLASDTILIGGYNKRYWLVLGCLTGLFSIGMSFLAFMKGASLALVFCLAGVNVQLALYDLLSEGKYSEIRNEHPEVGSDPTTLVQMMNTGGALVAMSFVGILADQGLFVVLFGLACGFAFLPLVPTLLGWLPEERYVNARWIQMVPDCDDSSSETKTRNQQRITYAVLFCGIASAIGTLTSTLLSEVGGLIISLVFLALSLVGCYFAFPPAIFQVAMYQVVTALAWPSMGGAMDFFYTADETCLPNGPHFSYVYYITYAGLVGTAISLVGTIVYQLALSRLRFRPVLLLTTLFTVIGGLGDLVLVMRWNLQWGIDDKTAYLLGEAILEPLLDTLNWIPASALIAMAVPKGMEASSFAFMAGISNFARMVAQLGGSVIYTMAGIQTTPTSDTPCNFEPLPMLIILCHIVLPLAISVPAVWLVPNLKQTDVLNDDTTTIVE